MMEKEHIIAAIARNEREREEEREYKKSGDKCDVMDARIQSRAGHEDRVNAAETERLRVEVGDERERARAIAELNAIGRETAENGRVERQAEKQRHFSELQNWFKHRNDAPVVDSPRDSPPSGSAQTTGDKSGVEREFRQKRLADHARLAVAGPNYAVLEEAVKRRERAVESPHFYGVPAFTKLQYETAKWRVEQNHVRDMRRAEDESQGVDPYAREARQRADELLKDRYREYKRNNNVWARNDFRTSDYISKHDPIVGKRTSSWSFGHPNW